MHKFTWEKMIPKHKCQTKCFQCMAEIQNQGWKVAVVQMASKGVSSANFVIYRWKLWLPTLGNEIKKRGQIIAVCLLATNLRYFFHKSSLNEVLSSHLYKLVFNHKNFLLSSQSLLKNVKIWSKSCWWHLQYWDKIPDSVDIRFE